jgi:hypothetical protein
MWRHRRRSLLIAAALLALVYGTVLGFLGFDQHSHSASDTLRPFLITVVPVWAIAIIGVRVLNRRAW